MLNLTVLLFRIRDLWIALMEHQRGVMQSLYAQKAKSHSNGEKVTLKTINSERAKNRFILT